MNSESIDQYWEEFKGGRRESFGLIYKHYKPLLLFFCLGKVKNIDLAESFASESLIKTLTQENPEKIKNLENWLFTLARNLCISHLRTVKRHNEILGELYADKSIGENPEVEQKQSLENINEMIKQELNDSEFQLWELHSQGFDNHEISQKVGMNPKTVANKKSDIRIRLRVLLKRNDY